MKKTIMATAAMLLAAAVVVNATQRLVIGEFFTSTS
jgi:hypothetical protein